MTHKFTQYTHRLHRFCIVMGMLLSLHASVSLAEVQIHPLVPGDEPDQIHTVRVNGHEAPVATNHGVDAYVNFSFNGTVTVEVTDTTGEISCQGCSEIRPQAVEESAVFTDSSVILTIDTPGVSAVRINSHNHADSLGYAGNSNYWLYIFANPLNNNRPTANDADVRNIMEYDIDSTGETVETATIQQAIDDASGSSRNVLFFPPGRYKTASILLKSNMTMYLSPGAIIEGSTNTDDYRDAVPWQPEGRGAYHYKGNYPSLVYINNARYTKLMGRGVIDGMNFIWDSTETDKPARANAFKVWNSSNVFVEGVIIRNASWWNSLVIYSDSVLIRNAKFMSQLFRNTNDALVLSGCHYSKVENCLLRSVDDCTGPKCFKQAKIEEQSLQDNTYLYWVDNLIHSAHEGAVKLGCCPECDIMEHIYFIRNTMVRGKCGLVRGFNKGPAPTTYRDFYFIDNRVYRTGEACFLIFNFNEDETKPEWYDFYMVGNNFSRDPEVSLEGYDSAHSPHDIFVYNSKVEGVTASDIIWGTEDSPNSYNLYYSPEDTTIDVPQLTLWPDIDKTAISHHKTHDRPLAPKIDAAKTGTQRIMLFDLQGRRVLTTKDRIRRKTIEKLDGSGIYLLQREADNGKIEKQLISR